MSGSPSTVTSHSTPQSSLFSPTAVAPPWNADVRHTLLPIAAAVDNCSLPTGPFGPNEHFSAWRTAQLRGASDHGDSDEVLIPFYLSAPQIQGSVAIKPVAAPTPPPKTRRTSSQSSHRKHNIAPLSHWLSQHHSDEGLEAAFKAHAELNERYTPEQALIDASAPIGFLRPAIVRAMLRDSDKMVNMKQKPCWKALYPEVALAIHTPELEGTVEEDREGVTPDCGPWAMAFEDWINESPGMKSIRKEHMDRLTRTWKEMGKFNDVLGGWRNEDYTIHGPTTVERKRHCGSAASTPATTPTEAQDCSMSAFYQLPGSSEAFNMERAATALFSLSTFGSHLTAYVISPDTQEYSIWVPRRSPTKQTWPGYLDNTVAGGIAAGDGPLDTIRRECDEEASIRGPILNRIKSTGLVTYTFRSESGWIQPETQYTFDLELPADGSIQPDTNDGEAIEFKLMRIPEVVDSIWRGDWKPNSALVMIDFMIRHSIVTPETDRRYFDLCRKLRNPAPLPAPA